MGGRPGGPVNGREGLLKGPLCLQPVGPYGRLSARSFAVRTATTRCATENVATRCNERSVPHRDRSRPGLDDATELVHASLVRHCAFIDKSWREGGIRTRFAQWLRCTAPDEAVGWSWLKPAYWSTDWSTGHRSTRMPPPRAPTPRPTVLCPRRGQSRAKTSRPLSTACPAELRWLCSESPGARSPSCTVAATCAGIALTRASPGRAAEQAVGETHVPGRCLHLDDVGQSDQQRGFGALLAEDADGDGQSD